MTQTDNYQATIGIECHVQLGTVTKLFAGVDNDARQAAPNSLVSHICFGLPGALPVLNQKAIEYAVRMAFAFHTTPQKYSYFERKHYFYPDLPKGYQITQLSRPIIKGGTVEIVVDGQAKAVLLNRVQIEEDAGKNTHPAGKDYSLVDLNRAGTPLLEIVSEPGMHTPAEAKAYAIELYLLARYCGVSDADLYHGNIRFDINVSVSDTPGRLGTRTETKNLNSFRSVEKAAEYEIKRQVELLRKGQKISQETRGWDEAKQKTFAQRGKEEAHDYRYMPEPDIPPVELSDEYIAKIQASMAVMPSEWRRRLASLGLDSAQIAMLLEAEVEIVEISYLGLIEQQLGLPDKAKFLANYFTNLEIPIRRAGKVGKELSNQSRMAIYDSIYSLLTAGSLSSTNGKLLITQLLKAGIQPLSIEKYAEDQGFVQLSDKKQLEVIVAEVVRENPSAAADIKSGETKAIGFLVGQVMKKSLGKANPGMATDLIKKHLEI